MTKIQLKNNYSLFKEDFKLDTGLEADQNIREYIAYYNARMSDCNHQVMVDLINRLELLPEKIRMDFSQMFLTHETFTKLTK